jgi:hypothetical protein
MEVDAMKKRALLLAALLGWAPGAWTQDAAAQAGPHDAETEGKGWEMALCGLSMLLPLSMVSITVRQCTRAYIAWTE